MKSIKEKAKENLEQNKDETLCVYDRYAGFVDGANYVLDAITSALDQPMNDYLKLQEVWETIRQLKK